MVLVLRLKFLSYTDLIILIGLGIKISNTRGHESSIPQLPQLPLFEKERKTRLWISYLLCARGWNTCRDNDPVVEHAESCCLVFSKRNGLYNEGKTHKIKAKLSASIFQKFNSFSKHFQDEVKTYLASPSQFTLDRMNSQAKDIAQTIKQKIPRKHSIYQLEILLAKIFAILSVIRSRQSGKKTNQSCMFRPHEIQVVTLFLLLGIVRQDSQFLSNRLAQVGTGEGKSVILAVLSAFLALIGFNVRCSCYSVYLSQRDESAFKKLYEVLNIQKKIKYGTFNQLCQEILNPGNHDFKKEVRQMLLYHGTSFFNRISRFFGLNLHQFQKKENDVTDNKTILLIDEADVFFQHQFYGSSYRPAIRLTHETVNQLLLLIWAKAKSGQLMNAQIFDEIAQSKQFIAVVSIYPTLEKILMNQINGMIRGAIGYQHNYLIIDERLVYRQNDTISKKVSYGYATVFANIYEYQQGKVSSYNYLASLCIELIIAEFSYALLPTYFYKMIGVTGTLKSMPEVKRKILQTEYKFANNYLIPSSFGINNKKKYSYCVVQEQNYVEAIISHIKSINSPRPIIIFFKTGYQLFQFFQNPLYLQFKKKTFVLLEQHYPSYRQNVVLKATSPDTISLMTKSFGRGTDFQVYDKGVEKEGVHIIQTFLSEDESQEIQIKGRTNRQNSEGSVHIVFKKTQLQQLSITEDLTDKQSEEIYRILLSAREKKSKQAYEEVMKRVKQENQRHKKVEQIYKSKELKQADLIEYIKEINKNHRVSKVNIKTILAVDATGSMKLVLSKIVIILRQTFQRVYQIFNLNRNPNSSMEIKLMFYRNYNSHPNQILQSSAFQANPNNLLSFLNKIQAKGGAGINREAIQVCFQAINKQKFVNQVILIGDAGYNFPNEIDDLRKKRPEKQWLQHGMAKTNAEQECQQLRKKNCPVHSFYIGRYAQNAFKTIQHLTRGEHLEFPVRDVAASDFLSDFIIKKILTEASLKQKKQGLDIEVNYLQEYQKRYS